MGVAIETGEVGEHGIQYSGVGRSGGLSIEVDGASSLVHDGCLLENAGGGAHHGFGAHASGGHGGILGLDSSLSKEGLLVGLDGGFDIDSGVSRRAFGDI